MLSLFSLTGIRTDWVLQLQSGREGGFPRSYCVHRWSLNVGFCWLVPLCIICHIGRSGKCLLVEVSRRFRFHRGLIRVCYWQDDALLMAIVARWLTVWQKLPPFLLRLLWKILEPATLHPMCRNCRYTGYPAWSTFHRLWPTRPT